MNDRPLRIYDTADVAVLLVAALIIGICAYKIGTVDGERNAHKVGPTIEVIERLPQPEPQPQTRKSLVR
jgi:hypothetical protein